MPVFDKTLTKDIDKAMFLNGLKHCKISYIITSGRNPSHCFISSENPQEK